MAARVCICEKCGTLLGALETLQATVVLRKENKKRQQGQGPLKYRPDQYMKIKLIIQMGFVITPVI